MNYANKIILFFLIGKSRTIFDIIEWWTEYFKKNSFFQIYDFESSLRIYTFETYVCKFKTLKFKSRFLV